MWQREGDPAGSLGIAIESMATAPVYQVATANRVGAARHPTSSAEPFRGRLRGCGSPAETGAEASRGDRLPARLEPVVRLDCTHRAHFVSTLNRDRRDTSFAGRRLCVVLATTYALPAVPWHTALLSRRPG